MKINLEDLTILKDYGKNDIYESLIVNKSPENSQLFVKKTHNSILQDETKKKYFENEIFINENFPHENIIKFIEKKEILNDIYLIFEAANGGSLEDYFKNYMKKNNKPFSEEIVQHLIKQIVNALKFLHEKNIIYRNIATNHIYLLFDNEEDLKKEDLLKVKVKIGNFHFSKVLEENELTHSFIGTPVYMDPNILICYNQPDKIAYEYMADIWALGCLCCELLTGLTPFDGNDVEDLCNNIKNEKYKIPKSLNLSKEAISFLTGILQYDPNKRFDINDVINHDFLNKNVKEFSHEGIENLGEVNEKEIILSINIY